MTPPLRFDQLDPDRQGVIRSTVEKMRARNASDADIDTYLTGYEHLAPRSAAPPAEVTPHGASGEWGKEAPDLDKLADRSALGNAGRSLLSGMTLGAGLKANAAASAGLDKLQGAPSFGDAYQTRLAAERTAQRDFSNAHPALNLTGELGGGLLAMLGTGGLSELAGGADATAQGARLIPRIVRATKSALGTGIDLGGVAGAVNADGGVDDRIRGLGKGMATGGLGALIFGPLLEAGAYGVSKSPIPNLVSRGASAAADAFPSAAGPLRTLAASLGTKGAASSEVAQAAHMDANAPRTTPMTTHPDVPTLGLDQGGANVEGLAKNIVNRPGPGGATVRNALQDRVAGMRPSVNAALDRGTGTTAQEGSDLIAELARAKDVIARANANRDPVDPATAWSKLTGNGNAPKSDALELLQGLNKERDRVGDQMYGDARRATEGQPIESPTLDAILQTPAGKLSFAWARAQKENRMSPLPTVANEAAGEVPAELQAFFKNPEDYAKTVKLSNERGFNVGDLGDGEEREVADAETLHFMKQRLSTLSRLGVNDGQQGAIATQAHSALNVWGKLRDELPDIWREADAVSAQHAKGIDLSNAGRNLTRTQINPAGNSKRAIANSLDAVESRVAGAPSGDADNFRRAAQSSIADLINERNPSSASLLRQLQNSSGAFSRKVAMALGDPNAPDELARMLTPKPEANLNETGSALARGLDVFKTSASPPANRPELSLAALKDDVATMAPDAREQLQKGAAQAVRGKWDATGRSVESPGRVFARSPERVEQVGHAFPSSQSAGAFQNMVKAWDDVASQKARILQGSDTKANLATEAARSAPGGMLAQLFHGNLGSAAGSLAKGVTAESSNAASRAVDSEIAKILMSTEPASLANAGRAAQLRARLDALRGRVAGLGAAERIPNNE